MGLNLLHFDLQSLGVKQNTSQWDRMFLDMSCDKADALHPLPPASPLHTHTHTIPFQGEDMGGLPH